MAPQQGVPLVIIEAQLIGGNPYCSLLQALHRFPVRPSSEMLEGQMLLAPSQNRPSPTVELLDW
jgi:hypothetical protein